MIESMQNTGLICDLVLDGQSNVSGSLRCPPGHLLALVGPSGAGKTSLLRILAGLDQSAKGLISLNGQEWLNKAKGINLSPQSRSIGLVFQQYALMPHLSALKNVAMASNHKDQSKRLEQARGALKDMGLTGDMIDRMPRQLSGGQQQRVSLARALVRQPGLLLLDEPFSAVDQVTRQRLYEVLARIREEHRIPIVLVTHDLNEAKLLADSMAVIDHGEILQSGSAREIYRKPRTRRVADLIGIQNRFSGVWLGGDPSRPGYGNLRWHKTLKPDDLKRKNGPVLKVVDKGTLLEGRHVNWIVPADALSLSPDYTPDGQYGDVLWMPVRVEKMQDLGEFTLMDAQLLAPPDRLFRLTLSGAVRSQYKLGQKAWLSMDQSLIHIMPRKRKSA